MRRHCIGGFWLGRYRRWQALVLVWVKIIIGQKLASVSPSDTSCIISSLLVCSVRYGAMFKIMGKFPVDLTYSELPSLAPKLASDVTSLSGSTGNLGDTARYSIVSVWF